MKLRKTQLATAIGAVMVAGAVQAQTVTPGQSQVGIQLYGHVNRAMMWADNNAQSKWFFVDGQPSSTRFGIQGTGQVQPGLRAGARIETEIRSNNSSAVSFAAPSNPAGGSGATTFTERWMDVFFAGSWGQVNLGQGAGAADGAMEVGLGGIDLALSNPMTDFGGGIPFTTSGNAVTALTPGGMASNLDFESRYDRLMYTSPVMGGFRIQVGMGTTNAAEAQEAKEASLWYSGKLAGDFQAAIGWSDVNVGPEHRVTTGGSMTWLSPAGFNFEANYGQRETGGAAGASRDITHWAIQLGYKTGAHAVGVKYEVTEDLAANGDELTGIGFGWVWTAARWAEIYASYIMFQGDRPGTPLNDITVGAVGTRIRF